jgi:hypothetical protein
MPQNEVRISCTPELLDAIKAYLKFTASSCANTKLLQSFSSNMMRKKARMMIKVSENI